MIPVVLMIDNMIHCLAHVVFFKSSLCSDFCEGCLRVTLKGDRSLAAPCLKGTSKSHIFLTALPGSAIISNTMSL